MKQLVVRCMEFSSHWYVSIKDSLRKSDSAISRLVLILFASLLGFIVLIFPLVITATSLSWLFDKFNLPHPALITWFCYLSVLALCILASSKFLKQISKTAGDEPVVDLKSSLFASIAVGFATLALLAPNLSKFGSAAIGIEGDRDWNVFLGWKIGNALKHWQNPFQFHDIIAPYGFNTLGSDGFLAPFISGAFNSIFPAELSHNLTVAVGAISCGLAGIYLARRFSANWIVQASVGVSLVLAPVVVFRMGSHLGLAFIFAPTLVVAECITALRAGKFRWLRIGIFLGLSFLTSFYFLVVAGAVFLVVSILITIGSRKAIKSIAAACAVLALIAIPFVVERVRVTSAEIRAGNPLASSQENDALTYNADVVAIATPLANFRIPWTSERLSNRVARTSGEGNSAFPGIILLIGGIGGFFLLRFRGRLAFGSVGLATWLISLGPSLFVIGAGTIAIGGVAMRWLPFQFISNLPLLESMRAPGRVSLLLPSFLAIGLAVALEFIRRGNAKKVVKVLLVAVILSSFVLQLQTLPQEESPMSSSESKAALRENLSSNPKDRILPVPTCSGPFLGPESWMQIVHKHETVGCQGPYLALPIASGMSKYLENEDLASLRCTPNYVVNIPTPFDPSKRSHSPGFVGLKDELGVRYLLIDNVALSECAPLEEFVNATFKPPAIIEIDSRWSLVDLDRL